MALTPEEQEQRALYAAILEYEQDHVSTHRRLLPWGQRTMLWVQDALLSLAAVGQETLAPLGAAGAGCCAVPGHCGGRTPCHGAGYRAMEQGAVPWGRVPRHPH